MIKIFKDYYDKNGVRYKVISFNGYKYACQSYCNGMCIYLGTDELFDSPPVKPTKTKFTDIVKEEKPEKYDAVESISEADYNEPVYEVENKENEKTIPLKDNTEETAGDFYADF